MKFDLELSEEPASGIKIFPEASRSLGYFWMGILGIYWAALCFGRADKAQTAVKVWIIVVAITLMLAGFIWAKFLANGARVLGATPIPRALWSEWLKGVLLACSKLWALAIGTATALLIVNEVPWAWSAVAALFSITLCLSLIAALSNFALWHRAWSWSIATGVLLIFIFITWKNFELSMSAAYGWYLPLVFLWPVLLRYFMRHWRQHPPVKIAGQDEKQFSPLKSTLIYFKRYTTLASAQSRREKMQNLKGNALLYSLFPWLAPSIFTTYLLQPWGSRAGLPHLMLLGLYALVAINAVSCKDLHWRYLLAPSGFRHGHIGTHLLTSSVSIAGASILFLVLGWFAFSWSIFGITPLRNIEIAAPYWIIFLEWTFALSVAIAIRGTQRVSWAGFGFAVALLFAGLFASYILLFVFNANVLSPWFIVGPEYAAILILGIIAMMALSNRIWTSQRLLPFIISGSAKADDIIAGGRWFPWPGRSY